MSFLSSLSPTTFPEAEAFISPRAMDIEFSFRMLLSSRTISIPIPPSIPEGLRNESLNNASTFLIPILPLILILFKFPETSAFISGSPDIRKSPGKGNTLESFSSAKPSLFILTAKVSFSGSINLSTLPVAPIPAPATVTKDFLILMLSSFMSTLPLKASEPCNFSFATSKEASTKKGETSEMP